MADCCDLQAVAKPKEYDDDDHQYHEYLDYDDGFGSIDIKKEYDQALLFCFPNLFDHQQQHPNYDHAAMETVVGGDEVLDQQYKPLINPVYGTTEIDFPPPHPTPAVDHIHHHHHNDHSDQQVQQQDIKKLYGSASNFSQIAPKLKKRKNQQKAVVVEVTADGLSSDPWAWRKYGQKPIKGSIYPRSYYRCSSSKGCMARRQVEQSCTDPTIFILTYTAHHNHAQPTRCNSLARINHNRLIKSTTPKRPATSDHSCKPVTKSKDSPFHSPTTTSVSISTEDEVLQQSNIKQETTSYDKFDDQGHTMKMEIKDEDVMVFIDDFFEGLDDSGGYKMESSSS